MIREPRAPSARQILLLLGVLICAALPAGAERRVAPGLAWCGGVAGTEDFAAIRAAGFDAVRVDLPWTEALPTQEVERTLAAAQAQNLRVILSLQATAPPADVGPVSPDNPRYVAKAKEWLNSVVDHLSTNAAVMAWMTPDEPEAALQASDEALRTFISARYGDLKTLNQAWGSRYGGFQGITAGNVLMLTGQRPLGICRAGTDLALYRQDAFVRLMRLWARAIRGADDTRPLLAGPMGRYRCLISVPDDYDGVVPRMAAITSSGHVSGTPVAIARHGGRRAAIASLPAGGILNALGAALPQGATGIAVENWGALRGDARTQQALAAALSGWRATGCLNARPRATTAILYEPFGESASNPSPLAIGYLLGADAGGLDALFSTFAQGTSFGQVDVLAQEDLTAGTLNGYRTLLCPMALSLTSEQNQALRSFAEAGGVVLADAGFGCYEAGGDLTSSSSDLLGLVGCRALWPPAAGTGVLRVYDKSRLFPSLRAGDVSGFDGNKQAFTEVAALMEPAEGSTPLAAALDATIPNRKLFGGVLVHPLGKGAIVYATVRLWQRWRASDPLFLLFHRDLMSREPALMLRGVPFQGGDVQAAAFEQGLTARNLGALAQLVTLDVPGEMLHAGRCLNLCREATAEGLRIQAGLSPGALGLYERTPIRCSIERGSATVAVEQYGPEGILIAICGGAPAVTLNDAGSALMKPGAPQEARLSIADGRYPVRPGSVHRVRSSNLDSGVVRENLVRVGPDARIDLAGSFFADMITITPAAGN